MQNLQHFNSQSGGVKRSPRQGFQGLGLNKREKISQSRGLSDVQIKRAFTLAEVLITLGIIGIVATLTIPTLVKDYQKKAYVSAFKKTHAELTEAFKRMRAVEGVDYVTATALFNARNDDSLWLGELNKYMNVTEFTKNISYSALEVGNDDSLVEATTLECSSSKCFQMQSGVVFQPFFHENQNNVIDISVDINGEKGPNKLGRDFFSFHVTNDGRVWGTGQDMPCGYEDDDRGINSALDCLTVALFSWQLSCNWDQMKNIEPSHKDYFRENASDMTDDEFETYWNSMSDTERQETIDSDAEGYANYEEQINAAKLMSQTGMGCAGRILEKGTMDY